MTCGMIVNFARSRGEINLVGFLAIVWYNKRKYHFCIKGENKYGYIRKRFILFA